MASYKAMLLATSPLAIQFSGKNISPSARDVPMVCRPEAAVTPPRHSSYATAENYRKVMYFVYILLD